jgi:NNP family nitrate/nitrite transporter-like MFS transporter
VVTKVGCSNINAWILTFTYGFCFGVELTVTNVAVQYFQEFFALSQSSAGLYGSIFGLCNILFRSLGGIASDWAATRFEMRGRLWALFIGQMLEGVVCIILGSMTTGFVAPDFAGGENTIGYTQVSGWVQPTPSGWVQVAGVSPVWVPFNGSCIDVRIPHCGSAEISITDAHRACLDARFAGLDKVVISEPPAPYGDGDNCVSNSGRLGVVVAILFAFSLFVQMSEGLTYGVVPFVSRPALGVVSGMVGAGGSAGGFLTNMLFFTADTRSDAGFVNMGVCILAVTSLLVFVYFPDMGSMFTKAGAVAYDPQRIHPPAGYRGADSLQYKASVTKTEDGAEAKNESATTAEDGAEPKSEISTA